MLCHPQNGFRGYRSQPVASGCWRLSSAWCHSGSVSLAVAVSHAKNKRCWRFGLGSLLAINHSFSWNAQLPIPRFWAMLTDQFLEKSVIHQFQFSPGQLQRVAAVFFHCGHIMTVNVCLLSGRSFPVIPSGETVNDLRRQVQQDRWAWWEWWWTIMVNYNWSLAFEY